MAKATALSPVSNGAIESISASEPYVARIVVVGSSPLLMHAYNVESVEAKGKAAKGSSVKKTDDVESFVYRMSDDDNRLGMPGANFCAALCVAAKSMQDPRSPRKSMMDLIKASVISLDPVAPFLPGVTEWDFIDRRRVVIQRNSVARARPAMNIGWRIAFKVLVNAPEYVPPDVLHSLASKAGMFQGIGDFRPTYGRFQVSSFEHGDMDSIGG